MNRTSSDKVRSSRISDVDRLQILDRLDVQDRSNPARNKRTGQRVVYRKNDVAVRVYHPGGSATSCLVATRNLSSGGASFLYEGFLHRGTRVEIVLLRRVGGHDVARGVVTHCELIARNAHLVGVKFETRIFPKIYLDPEEWGILDVVHLDDERKAAMVSNLMVVLCSERETQPIVNTGTLYQ
ncbi:MAG: PilZ domain-containing protein [Burkholderiales bacterium]|nr:PilZ domain-containing protein [Phycisphaerae bacterium]